jgi:hypothetical protein
MSCVMSDYVLHALTVVSHVQVNDKLWTDGIRFGIRPPSYVRILVRLWYDESRTKSIDMLQSTLISAFTRIRLARYEGHRTTEERLQNALISSVRGLKCMLETYKDDVESIAKLTIMISDVERFTSCTPRVGADSFKEHTLHFAYDDSVATDNVADGF